MAQKLFVKMKKPDGTATTKAVYVLRSWQESDGRQIYLHANGVYGYKDGSPVMGRDEFDIIGSPNQRKLALAWWDRVGQKLSAAHCQAIEEAEEARQLEGLPAVEGESSDLDAMMYARRATKGKGKKREAWSDPATWPEYGFRSRPDWWGFAEQISIAGHEYEIVAVEQETAVESQESGVGGQESEGKGQESGVGDQESAVKIEGTF